ncbi:MAG: tetratricopeptide repeat protein [Planctomycetes bacterium]|nr:tetratricopeptide repeat protein [Planctomycetota bacterium]
MRADVPVTASKMSQLLSYLVSPARFLRRTSPFKTVLVVSLSLIAAGAAGVFYWGWHHLQAAQEAIENYQFEAARQHLKRSLAVWPGSRRANLLAARVARVEGDYVEARKYLAACQRAGGMTEDLELEWLLLRAAAGEFPALESRLRKLADAGKSPLVLEALVSCLYKESRHHLANYYLNQWLSTVPNSMAYFWRGIVREKLRMSDEAMADYARALELDPGRFEARLPLVRLHLEKSSGEARTHLDFLKKNYPDSPEVMLLLGMDQRQQGHLSEAEKYIEQALQARPNDSMACYQAGLVQLDMGRPTQAEEWLRKALKADPASLAVRYALYLCLQRQAGRGQEARSELLAYKEEQDKTRRLQALLERVEKQPENADLLVEASEAFLERKQLFQHRQYLQRALQHQPGHARALELMADVSRHSPR